MFEGAKIGHRFFFAIVPPILLARQIANAALWFADGGTPVRAERLHITLFILDDFVIVPKRLIETLRAVGGRIAAAPIPVELDLVGGGAASIALRPRRVATALHDLHRQIATAAASEGVDGREDYAFRPHLTLGYRHGAPFSERVAPVGWTADRLLLIHSHLGRTRHEVVGEWALDGGAQGSLF
ncbi:MAG: 2'-5' RNA ligase family protein [Sphingomonas sp.]